MDTKKCSTCKKTQSAEEFVVLKTGLKGATCNRCRHLTEEWREHNPERVSFLSFRNYLKRLYSLEIEDFRAMGDACWICGTTDPGANRKHLHVDHDHACCPSGKSCGKCVRGLLCNDCNLGHFKDDPELLRRMADYIEKFRAERGFGK
jgi:hypothetical protein